MGKRLTTEEFIKRSKVVHGDKYDYNFANYTHSKTKVKIVCREHGIFEQRPNDHLNGQGCSKCKAENLSVNQTSNTDDFISKAKVVHGDKYDYNFVNYSRSQIKVKIICPEHGEFLQTPNSHLNGCGCNRCSVENLAVNRKSNSTEFTEKAKVVHGDKYIYSVIEYVNCETKVKITCPEHGEFIQTPNNHLKGFGCPSCAGNARHNFDSLYKKIKEVHNGEILLIKWQEINGINKKYKFKHSCGRIWSATANSVLSGRGCPSCAISGFKTDKPATFYILGINGGKQLTGFGISNAYKKRLSEHKRNLKANNCSIISEILIHSDGITIQKLEQYVKFTLQCNNSTVKGFRTESVLITPEELLDFCTKWLTEQKVIYKIESKSG